MDSTPWDQVYNATGVGMLGSVLGRYQNPMVATWQMTQRSMHWLVAITVALLGLSTAAPAAETGCEVAVSGPFSDDQHGTTRADTFQV